jgi:hypothetical protein
MDSQIRWRYRVQRHIRKRNPSILRYNLSYHMLLSNQRVLIQQGWEVPNQQGQRRVLRHQQLRRPSMNRMKLGSLLRWRHLLLSSRRCRVNRWWKRVWHHFFRLGLWWKGRSLRIHWMRCPWISWNQGCKFILVRHRNPWWCCSYRWRQWVCTSLSLGRHISCYISSSSPSRGQRLMVQ